jgi:hypothetical protein
MQLPHKQAVSAQAIIYCGPTVNDFVIEDRSFAYNGANGAGDGDSSGLRIRAVRDAAAIF